MGLLDLFKKKEEKPKEIQPQIKSYLGSSRQYNGKQIKKYGSGRNHLNY